MASKAKAARTRRMRKCRSCGEPEMVGFDNSGEFGWFTTDEGTFCLRCGTKQR